MTHLSRCQYVNPKTVTSRIGEELETYRSACVLSTFVSRRSFLTVSAVTPPSPVVRPHISKRAEHSSTTNPRNGIARSKTRILRRAWVQHLGGCVRRWVGSLVHQDRLCVVNITISHMLACYRKRLNSCIPRSRLPADMEVCTDQLHYVYGSVKLKCNKGTRNGPI